MPRVRVNGIDLHYIDLGGPEKPGKDAGDALVLVHGLAANLGFWFLKLAPAFARRQRVILYDLRGHGLSSMPMSGYRMEQMSADLAALLDLLGIRKADLLGHSLGGCVVADFATRHPERVHSLILVDTRLRALQPTSSLRNWEHWPRYRAALMRSGIVLDESTYEFGFQLFQKIAEMRLASGHTIEGPPDVLPPLFVGPGGKRAAARWLKLLKTTTLHDDLSRGDDITIDRLASLVVPTLVVYGEYSRSVPTAMALARLWPHARIVRIPRAGHFFPVAFPESLERPVEEFLDEAPGHRALHNDTTRLERVENE